MCQGESVPAALEKLLDTECSPRPPLSSYFLQLFFTVRPKVELFLKEMAMLKLSVSSYFTSKEVLL